MAIWDLIGGLSDGLDWGLTNSTYQNTLGDYVQFAIGGGYTTNILGTQATLVIDWESVLEHHFGPITSGWGVAGGLLFGIGGDTSMLWGNRSEFSYQGCDFSVSRGRTNPPMECHYVDNQLSSLGLNNWKPNIYNAPVYAVMLGSLALFTAALVLQFKYKAGLTGDPASSEAEILAVEIIPTVETRWLWVVKLLEYIGSTIIPLRGRVSNNEPITAIQQQIVNIKAQITAQECKVIDLKNQIAYLSQQSLKASDLVKDLFENRKATVQAQLKLVEKDIKDYTKTKGDLVKDYARQVEAIVGDSLGIFSKLV